MIQISLPWHLLLGDPVQGPDTQDSLDDELCPALHKDAKVDKLLADHFEPHLNCEVFLSAPLDNLFTCHSKFSMLESHLFIVSEGNRFLSCEFEKLEETVLAAVVAVSPRGVSVSDLRHPLLNYNVTRTSKTLISLFRTGSVYTLIKSSGTK